MAEHRVAPQGSPSTTAGRGATAPTVLVVGRWDDDGRPDAETGAVIGAAWDGSNHTVRVVGVRLGGRSGTPPGVNRGAVLDATFDAGRLVGPLQRLVTDRAADAVVLAAGPLAEDLAPQLAAGLGAVTALDCRSLWRTESEAGPTWSVTRPAFGGALEVTWTTPPGSRLVASVDTAAAVAGSTAVGSDRAEVLDAAVIDVVELDLAAVPGADAVSGDIEVVRAETPTADDPLSRASRIVAGGRGLGGPEGFAVLGELADLLDARLGASRPPCDAGWVPGRYQVGITGSRVAPELYVAVGISGSIQHLAGMRSSRRIVAVNNDPDAPIFRYSDLGVVGDWRDVVAGLLDGLGDRDPSRTPSHEEIDHG